MPTVTGLFRDRDEALVTLERLREAGFGPDELAILASPTSAGIAAEQAANALPRPGDGFIDFGAALGGQAAPGFPREERLLYEERIAAGDVLLRVQTDDPKRASLAHAMLEDGGAERVGPGVILE
jgi:hypothetical protein